MLSDDMLLLRVSSTLHLWVMNLGTLNILMCRQDVMPFISRYVFPTHHQRISRSCVSLYLPSVTDQLMKLARHRIGGA